MIRRSPGKGHFFNEMSHNGRVATLTEPVWSVPFNIISVYATLYMLAQGLSNRQAGITQSVLVASQILSSIFSGKITQILGRRKTTLIFDFISWGLACLVWAIADSFVGFLVAAVLNGINKIVFVSFNCILTEGSSSLQRLRNYTGLHLMVIAGGLAAPLGGLIVGNFGLVPSMRRIYLFSGIIMSGMFLVRHVAWKEPQRLEGIVTGGVLKGIAQSFHYFTAEQRRRTIFYLLATFHFTMIFKPLFYFAYLKDYGGITELWLSWIPVMLSLVSLGIFFIFLPRIGVKDKPKALTFGLILGGLSMILLILTPRAGLPVLGLSILFDGMSMAIIRPIVDSFWADSLQDSQRDIQLGSSNLLIGLLTIPAGILSAELYRLAPGLPFLATAGLFFLVSLLSVRLIRDMERE